MSVEVKREGHCASEKSCAKCAVRPHSIILASCKPGQKPGFHQGFQQVRAGFRPAFDFFGRKPGHETAESVSTCRDWCNRLAAGSLVRARARQMECRKIRFEPANEPAEAGFSLGHLFYYSCLSWWAWALQVQGVPRMYYNVHHEILHVSTRF